jgi:peroxiredoxin
MSLNMGQEAPEFILPDSDRKVRKLSDFRGKKTVLAFFPGAFTSVCTKEMCTLRDSMANFERLNAQIVGISVNDPFTLKSFAEINRLRFPLLSDYSRAVVERYGIAHYDFAGLKGYTVAKRSVFILDDKGRLVYKWVSDDPGKEPDYNAIQKVLDETR